jgi:hypothetical protein
MLFESKIVGYFRRKTAASKPRVLPRGARRAQAGPVPGRGSPSHAAEALRGGIRIILWLLELIGNLD